MSTFHTSLPRYRYGRSEERVIGQPRRFRVPALSLLAAMLVATILYSSTGLGSGEDSLAAFQSSHSYKGTAQGSPYTGDFAGLAAAIDDYWRATLENARVPYRSPEVAAIEDVTSSGCGLLYPELAALYCSRDSTIYLSPSFLAEQERDIGDYATITTLAHEWGHHVQALTRTPDPGGNAYELQADCLAGVYTEEAEAKGLLDPGDITEAVIISQSAGDPLGLPQDRPGSHGINDDRIKAFMRGYLNGLAACKLPMLGSSTSDEESQSPLPASDYLPRALPVSYASCFQVQGQGEYPYADVVSFLAQAGASPAEINALDWQDGAYRDFRCAHPPEGGAAFLEVVLHRFATAEAASIAVSYWQSGYVPTQSNEVYVCDSAGVFVVCADGNGPSGPPREEVRELLSQVLATIP